METYILKNRAKKNKGEWLMQSACTIELLCTLTYSVIIWVHRVANGIALHVLNPCNTKLNWKYTSSRTNYIAYNKRRINSPFHTIEWYSFRTECWNIIVLQKESTVETRIHLLVYNKVRPSKCSRNSRFQQPQEFKNEVVARAGRLQKWTVVSDHCGETVQTGRLTYLTYSS